jgi:hypothetical protein
MAVPRFIGRSDELQHIKNCWRKATEGQPQVVNLIADTGVGKTRLVHAFYEWLSTEPGQGGGADHQNYWPTDLGTGRQRVVNPPLERFGSFDLTKSRIPWLWWGLYWTDADGENACALVRFHDILNTHLKMLELERRCRLNNWETLSDAARDEVLNFMSDFIPGAGQVKNVVSLAKRLHANYQERQQANRGIAEDCSKQRESLAEDILDRLQVVFNPKYKDVPRLPLVLFLDDIHFATDISGDFFTLQFLDCLLRRAAREQWPLMVVATHWKGPWNAHLTWEGGKEDKPWRRLMLELGAQENAKTPDMHTLELSNVPYDDLRAVALDLLPGLAPNDQKTLLSRVDNVRWLVEVLHALSDYVENFEEYDLRRPLSCRGHLQLEELLKTRGYLEVLRKRLKGKAMLDVRNVLGATAWHAHELEFLSPLGRAFGEVLMEHGALATSHSEPGQRVLDVLLRALNPAALLEGQCQDDQLPTLVRFPERGYMEIAKELFDLEHLPNLRLALGREIVTWMSPQDRDSPRWQQLEDISEKKTFLEIALAVLEQLQPQLSEEQRHELATTEKALHKQVDKGRITEEELEEELEEARNELLREAQGSQLPEASLYHALVMAELSCILHAEGDGRAWALAFSLAEHPQLFGALEATTLNTKFSLTSLWQDKTDYWPLVRQLLQDVIDEQVALLKVEETPDRLRDLVVPLMCLADLDQAAGDTESARAGYRRSLAIREKLLAEYGENPGRLRGLVVPLMRLADLDRTAGDTDSARAGYRRSLCICEHLLAEYGENPDRLRDLTIHLESLADLDRASGATDSARAGYQLSLAIEEKLLAEYGENPERLRGLTVPLMRLGDLDVAAGATESARVGYRRSLGICEQLLAEYGENPERLRDLIVTQERLADLDRAAGATESARVGYRRSLDICEQLLTEYGESPDRLRDLIVPLVRLADLDRAAGATASARAGYRRSLAICEQLLAEYGENPQRLRDLTITLERLANMDATSSATELARSGYRRSLAIREKLLAEYGENPNWLHDMAITLARLALLDALADATESAWAGYRRSLAIREHLLAEHCENSEQLQQLNNILKYLEELDM